LRWKTLVVDIFDRDFWLAFPARHTHRVEAIEFKIRKTPTDMSFVQIPEFPNVKRVNTTYPFHNVNFKDEGQFSTLRDILARVLSIIIAKK
jgi:hypothetical protein